MADSKYCSHTDVLNKMIAQQCPDYIWEPEGKARFSFEMHCDGTMWVIAKKVNGCSEPPYKYKVLEWEFVPHGEERTIGKVAARCICGSGGYPTPCPVHDGERIGS